MMKMMDGEEEEEDEDKEEGRVVARETAVCSPCSPLKLKTRMMVPFSDVEATLVPDGSMAIADSASLCAWINFSLTPLSSSM